MKLPEFPKIPDTLPERKKERLSSLRTLYESHAKTLRFAPSLLPLLHDTMAGLAYQAECLLRVYDEANSVARTEHTADPDASSRDD